MHTEYETHVQLSHDQISFSKNILIKISQSISAEITRDKGILDSSLSVCYLCLFVAFVLKS